MGRFKLIEGGRPQPANLRDGDPQFREPARSLDDYGEGEDTQIMMPDSIVLDETISRTGDRYVEEEINGRPAMRGDSLDIDADTLFNEIDVSEALSVLEDSSDVIRPAPERDVMASSPPPRLPLPPESEPQVSEWRTGVEAGQYTPAPPAMPGPGSPVPMPGPAHQTGPFPTGTTDPGMQLGPYQVAYGPVPVTGPYTPLPGYPPQIVTGSYPQYTMPFPGAAPGPSSTFKTVMIAAAVVIVAAGGVALGWVLFGGRDKPAPAPAAQAGLAPATSAAGTAPTAGATPAGPASQSGPGATQAATPGQTPAAAASTAAVPGSAGAQPNLAGAAPTPAGSGTPAPGTEPPGEAQAAAAAGHDGSGDAAQPDTAGDAAQPATADQGATSDPAADVLREEVSSIEHPSRGSVNSPASGDVRRAPLRRNGRIKKGERLFVISHKHPDGPKAAQLAARIKELQGLAKKEPDVYNAFLKRARAEYRRTQSVDHEVVTARQTGLVESRVADGDHVRKGDLLAELVDGTVWVAHATFEAGDPQQSWTCSVTQKDGDKRAACQIRAIKEGKRGHRVTVDVSAHDAPWLDGHEHHALVLELAPPATH